MSDKGLTTFEKRFEDWRVDYPWQWIATTDRAAAAKFISDQTEKIRRTQLEAADRIIVSQERIASGIDEIAVGVDRVADGLEGLASAFEWGFSVMVWHLEQQRSVLQEILKVLQAPLDTQAKELKKRAENAYQNGWIPDAIEDFLQSERKNRYDFTVHQSLGNIYLFHKKNPEKALEYYEKAVKYATPESSYHASIALLHIGLTKYLQEDFQKAYEATSKAIELSPNLYEAHYQCAQYCANLDKYDEALDHLWKAIEGDRNYCLKAESEKDFDVMRKELQSFFKDLRDQAQKEAKEETDKAEELIAYAKSFGLLVSGESQKFKTSVEKYGEATEFLKRASLFDYWDAIDMARDVQELVLDASEGYLSDQKLHVEKEYRDKRERLNKEAESRAIFPSLVLSPLIIGAIAVVIGAIINVSIGVCGGIALLLIGGAPLFNLLKKSFSNIVFDTLIKEDKGYYKSKLARTRANLMKVGIKREQLSVVEEIKSTDLEAVRGLAAIVHENAKRLGKKDEYPREQLWEIYQKLPTDLQKAAFSEEVASSIQEICAENGVTSNERVFNVSKLVGYVFLGVLQPNEFRGALEKKVGLGKRPAGRIAQEIRDYVFLSVKDSLEALYKMKIVE